MPLIASARRGLRLTQTCDIKRVPAGATNPAARETVAAGVSCSMVYPASSEQSERAGMAQAARLMVVYTSATAAQTDWRVRTGGRDYRIRAVSPWPRDAAAFVELLIEEEV
jgi:hypothetical protein